MSAANPIYKAHTRRNIATTTAQYRLTEEECAFIGDGANDVPIASSVGTSVAYNGHPSLTAVTGHAISDFEQLLSII